MSRRRGMLGPVAVTAAAAAVLLAGSTQPSLPRELGSPTTRPVSRASASCPELATGSHAASTVFAVAPTASGPGSPDGSIRVAAVPSAASDLGSATIPGVPLEISPGPSTPTRGAVVNATRDLAPGLTAAQWTTSTARSNRGLAAAWCQPPAAEWWFNGVDTAVGTTTRLVVSNPSPGVAVFDLKLFGPAGVVSAEGSRGIAVAPQSRLVLDLARYAPGRAALTVRVTATRGRVAAAVETSRLEALTPTGTEWVPAAAAPSRRVLVTAGFIGSHRQRLAITNPGDRQALVHVKFLDAAGEFTATALGDIQVPPGSVVTENISGVVAKTTAAVLVSSTGAVAAATVSESRAGVRDFAVSAAVPALSRPAVVPIIPATRLELALTCGARAGAVVRIRSYDRHGRRLRSTRVDLKGAATTTWTPRRDARVRYVEVTPLSGSDVHAVADYSGTAGIASLPVLSGRWTVTRPAVEPTVSGQASVDLSTRR